MVSVVLQSNECYACSSVTTFAGVWKVQPANGTRPPPLANHTFTKIDNHRAVAFGGYTGSCRVNDAYVLDMKIWVCRKNVVVL